MLVDGNDRGCMAVTWSATGARALKCHANLGQCLVLNLPNAFLGQPNEAAHLGQGWCSTLIKTLECKAVHDYFAFDLGEICAV